MMKSVVLALIVRLAICAAASLRSVPKDEAPLRTGIFSKARCLLAIYRLDLEIGNFDKYPTYFHDDSTMELAQAGEYHGADGIEEYVKFTFPDFSPYLAPGSSKDRPLTIKVLGYRESTGECEFLVLNKFEVTANPLTTAALPPFNTALMGKVYMNLSEKYIRRFNAYFVPDFIRLVFDNMLDSPQTKRFICEQAMFGNCATTFNSTVSRGNNASMESAIQTCIAKLDALPSTEGEEAYIDGNSNGCRALHGSFAATNAKHCPHISFEPMEDKSGRIKCQASTASTHHFPKDMFTESDMEAYSKYARRNGIDPEKGHDYVSN